ncbi:MAG: TRAM domain-containing protein, partial [Lentihominibacter sp.]
MIVEIRIEDMSSQGQGIGKADGFVVFVPGAVVG